VRKSIGIELMVVGAILLIVAVGADLLPFSVAGFGWKQIVGTVAGLVILARTCCLSPSPASAGNRSSGPSPAWSSWREGSTFIEPQRAAPSFPRHCRGLGPGK
jgi:hypothetical protein